MFRPATNIFVTLVLLVAMALAGVVPASGACNETGNQCGSKQCCGACCTKSSEPTNSCCSTSTQVPSTRVPSTQVPSTRARVCHCSVENERPATPPERRGSDERNDARRAERMASVIFVSDDESRVRFIEDATLSSILSASHRQAVLCRWLI